MHPTIIRQEYDSLTLPNSLLHEPIVLILYGEAHPLFFSSLVIHRQQPDASHQTIVSERLTRSVVENINSK